MIGDWDADFTDNVGLYNDGRFYLDTTNNGRWDRVSGGDTFFDYGLAGVPIVGHWTTSPVAARAASTSPTKPTTATDPLAEQENRIGRGQLDLESGDELSQLLIETVNSPLDQLMPRQRDSVVDEAIRLWVDEADGAGELDELLLDWGLK